jgi:hypothetical protein
MNVEKLECDKTDTEIIIQELNNTSEYLEELQSNSCNSIVKLKLRSFIKELDKEIEWNEQILQELEQSINFFEIHDNRRTN